MSRNPSQSSRTSRRNARQARRDQVRNQEAPVAEEAPEAQVEDSIGIEGDEVLEVMAGNPPVADDRHAFFLCPAAANTGVIDFATKEGRKLYADASGKLCDDAFSCDPDEYHDLIQVVTSRAMEWSWDSGIMMIQSEDDGPRVSLLQEHGKISIGQIRRHERTYIHTESRQAQDTYMLYQALLKSLSKIGRSKIILERKDYEVVVEGRVYHSGTLLLKVILTKMHLETKAAARGIRTRLSNLDTYITKIGYDIVKFNKYVKSQMQHLAAKGETTNDLVDNVLKAYENVPGEDWKAWNRRVTDKYEDGYTIAINDLLEKAEAKYKTLVDNEKWNVMSDNEKQIIALQAQIKNLTKNGKKGGQKSDTKKKSARKTRESKYTQIKDKIPKDPKKAVIIEGKKFWWCGKATGGHCEKLTRHHPSKCVAGFSTMTADQRKAVLGNSGQSKKKLTIKETIFDDERSSEGEGGGTEIDEDIEDVDEVEEGINDIDLDSAEE